LVSLGGGITDLIIVSFMARSWEHVIFMFG